jgi:hypothetical protein
MGMRCTTVCPENHAILLSLDVVRGRRLLPRHDERCVILSAAHEHSRLATHAITSRVRSFVQKETNIPLAILVDLPFNQKHSQICRQFM